MNRHLREALRADAYDSIEFHLDSYDVHSRGSLTARIAGTERAIVIPSAVEADTLGMVHVRGAHTVRMTDFGVQPPRRFAGLLRVRDSVVVYFDIVPGPLVDNAVIVSSPQDTPLTLRSVLTTTIAIILTCRKACCRVG